MDPGETNRQSVDISAYAMIVLEGGTADSRLFGKQTAQKAEKDKICPEEDFVPINMGLSWSHQNRLSNGVAWLCTAVCSLLAQLTTHFVQTV